MQVERVGEELEERMPRSWPPFRRVRLSQHCRTCCCYYSLPHPWARKLSGCIRTAHAQKVYCSRTFSLSKDLRTLSCWVVSCGKTCSKLAAGCEYTLSLKCWAGNFPGPCYCCDKPRSKLETWRFSAPAALNHYTQALNVKP